MWKPITEDLQEEIFFKTCIKNEKGINREVILKKIDGVWYNRTGTPILEEPTHYQEMSYPSVL